ncbi:Oxaloacetate decarboxylase gamma chain [hydrothermal vent metagenome]|uniref:Oxaloacetate decarboxylase gamma chain n=1 Tax=hydrothermal vent metagenome TaxID=652676 RepID=A0A1W1CZB5_9ZZZZ
MEDVNLIFESVKFMVLGMTVVFSFLLILIVVVELQAKLIAKFFPEEAPKVPVTPNTTDDAHHVAAIIAAVTEFRKKS